jgi:thiol:disulfide interchange protein DsbD
MEATVLADSAVTDIIYKKFLYVQLFVDDRTKAQEGFEETVVVNGKKKTLTTLGEIWSHLQAEKFGANSQPFYVIVDANDQMLVEPYTYDEDVDKFIAWLKRGLKAFENRKK